MTALLTALRAGLSAEKILAYLSRKAPELAPKIARALASGTTSDQVVKFFAKDKNFDRLKNSMQKDYSMENNANPLVQAANVRQKNLAPDMASSLQSGTKQAIQGAAGLGAGMALNHALPNLLKGSIPEKIGKIQETSSPTPPLPNVKPEGSKPPVSPNIAQPVNPVQPEVKSINSEEILNTRGVKDQVDALIASKNGPEEVSAFFEKFKPKDKKAIEKESGMPFDKVIEDYFAKRPKESEIIPEVQPKIEKSSIVASPQGVGEVKSIRNGKALVEVDGKTHQVNEDELIQSPLPEKDLADLYDDVISGIEKNTGQQVSRNVDWSGYDPNTNELAYKPHGSDKLYIYDDISPEDVKELTNLLTQRKSTGQNFIGAWEAGTTSPIGAAMYQLIKKLQSERGGKGNEYKNKYETIYDALEPAKKAAKEKHAKRKKEAKKSGTH
jgi:hypothetical protein